MLFLVFSYQFLLCFLYEINMRVISAWMFLFLCLSDVFLKIFSLRYVRETSAQIFHGFQTILNKNSETKSPSPQIQCWVTVFLSRHAFLSWYTLDNIERRGEGAVGWGEGAIQLKFLTFSAKKWLSHNILLMVVWILKIQIAIIFWLAHYLFDVLVSL